MTFKNLCVLMTILLTLICFTAIGPVFAKDKVKDVVKSAEKTTEGAEKVMDKNVKEGTKKLTGAKAAMKEKIDINKADLETLTSLPGIGEERAKSIIDYRKTIGSFKNIEDLKNVSGIGEKLLEKIKPLIKF